MFDIKKSEGSSRQGLLGTSHGQVQTPCFMPVATKGAVKHMTTPELEAIGTDCLISNSFLLYLQPGLSVIEEHGGLHRFMGWDKALFTDNGAFQMLRSFYEGYNSMGIRFKSPFDGKRHLLSPRLSMEIQGKLGSDVAMALDCVVPNDSGRKVFEDAVKHSTKWGAESLKYRNEDQLVFGIAHGGIVPDLREKHAKEMSAMDFDGFALGGLCIGESKGDMYSAIDASVHLLPPDKPRYLMGVGTPVDILECVARGIDIFDSVFPTQTARHNLLFTRDGPLKLTQAKYREDTSPVDPECSCPVCKRYSRASLSYLTRLKEPIAWQLKTYHNLFFVQQLMADIRTAIKEGQFFDYKESFLKRYLKKE